MLSGPAKAGLSFFQKSGRSLLHIFGPKTFSKRFLFPDEAVDGGCVGVVVISAEGIRFPGFRMGDAVTSRDIDAFDDAGYRERGFSIDDAEQLAGLG